MMSNKKRSPLSNKTLRQPGSHAREQVLDVFFNLTYISITWVCLFVLMLDAWWNLYSKTLINPWFFTISFLLFTVYFVYQFRSDFNNINNLSLGFRGEVAVGQLLEGLRAYGYTPIHDIPCVGNNGKNFNIDHVIIGPKGIFAVETKTWSKSRSELETITYSNNSLFTGRQRRGDQEIQQAKNNAKWLSKMLERRTGITYEVDSILTFPGWWIEQNATNEIKKKYGVLTLNPNAIGKYLGNFDNKFSDGQIQHLAKALSFYVYEQAEKNLKN